MTNLSVAELVEMYAVAAARRRRLSTSDPDGANAAHDVVAAVRRERRDRGPEAQRALLRLLRHDDPNVRGWAGAHGLEFAPEEAEPVLEQLAQRDGATGFSAETTLEVWRSGELRFP